MIIQSVRGVAAGLSLLVCAGVQAGNNPACDDAAFAEKFAAAYRTDYKAISAKMEGDELGHAQQVEAFTAALIKGGAWSSPEAAAQYLANARNVDADAVELAAAKKKHERDILLQLTVLDSFEFIASANKEVAARARCNLADGLIAHARLLADATGRASALLETKLRQVAKEKKIPL
ncbi:hypothetical protein [Massilia glaciei]|uniref:DUF2202 domain-containing protein n=1 Tax=Massilia glaciei TaxID=1524097 RepID=A0A2U2HI23_9BURK|nr:hypothetical protein [Massilia glaciei]PWF45992.1 hypothetical protein C7C56_016865 [Massilia glaciei]